MLKVIFRVWKDTGDVIAFLPEVEANPGQIMSYMHVGQHGEADYFHCLKVTRPASNAEAQPLARELHQIYETPLKPLKRLMR